MYYVMRHIPGELPLRYGPMRKNAAAAIRSAEKLDQGVVRAWVEKYGVGPIWTRKINRF